MGWEMGEGFREAKKGGFVTSRDPGPGPKTVQGHTLKSPQSGLRLSVPEVFLTLIQQNAALLFGDIPDLKPVWLSGAISQLKMTANSTYCEAKLCSYGLGVAVWGGRGKKGGFGGVIFW